MRFSFDSRTIHPSEGWSRVAATIALEMIGPMPGTLISRSQPASWRAMASISLDERIDPLIEPAPVARQAFNHPHHAWRQDFWGRGQDAWELGTQNPLSVPNGSAQLLQSRP